MMDYIITALLSGVILVAIIGWFDRIEAAFQRCLDLFRRVARTIMGWLFRSDKI